MFTFNRYGCSRSPEYAVEQRITRQALESALAGAGVERGTGISPIVELAVREGLVQRDGAADLAQARNQQRAVQTYLDVANSSAPAGSSAGNEPALLVSPTSDNATGLANDASEAFVRQSLFFSAIERLPEQSS